jgi:hypothetical protein
MSYSAEINRNNPSCFLFMIDQSGSMNERMDGGESKADFVAHVINRTLAELVIRCTRADGVRDYFDIGIIAYGHNMVKTGFTGVLSGYYIHSISAIAKYPVRIDKKTKSKKDPSGEIYEKREACPVWFEPRCSGVTPMRKAFEQACRLMQEWCDNHAGSYPPTVFHVSDGRSTDGNPEDLARILTRLHTNDGRLLLFNLHVDTGKGEEILFPSTSGSLMDDYSAMLFRISSHFPPHIIPRARQYGYKVSEKSRFFIYKASMDFIIHFFEMGTRPVNLR